MQTAVLPNNDLRVLRSTDCILASFFSVDCPPERRIAKSRAQNTHNSGNVGATEYHGPPNHFMSTEPCEKSLHFRRPAPCLRNLKGAVIFAAFILQVPAYYHRIRSIMLPMLLMKSHSPGGSSSKYTAAREVLLGSIWRYRAAGPSFPKALLSRVASNACVPKRGATKPRRFGLWPIFT